MWIRLITKMSFNKYHLWRRWDLYPDVLTIAVKEDEAEGHQHGMPVEVYTEVSSAPGQTVLVMLHPVHSQAEQQQTHNLENGG